LDRHQKSVLHVEGQGRRFPVANAQLLVAFADYPWKWVAGHGIREYDPECLIRFANAIVGNPKFNLTFWVTAMIRVIRKRDNPARKLATKITCIDRTVASRFHPPA
jgi:hypothetical protein